MTQSNKPKRPITILFLCVVTISILFIWGRIVQIKSVNYEARILSEAVQGQSREYNEVLLPSNMSDSSSKGSTGSKSSLPTVELGRAQELVIPYSSNALASRLELMGEDFRAVYLSVVSRYEHIFAEMDIDPQSAANLMHSIAESLFELQNMQLAFQAGEISREDYIALTSELSPGRFLRATLSDDQYQAYTELRLTEEIQAFASAIYDEMYRYTPNLDIATRDRVSMAYVRKAWEIPDMSHYSAGPEMFRYRNQYIMEVVMPEIIDMVARELSDNQLQEVMNYLEYKSLELERMNQNLSRN